MLSSALCVVENSRHKKFILIYKIIGEIIMMLEAVWFLNDKEVYKVSPVMNIVCYEDMENVSEIEVEDGSEWHSCRENQFEADNFIIRIKKG